ncbi:MAG: biotin--[acetyl-CoA-carboxylase] ligase [Bacteroidia bacterium]
MKIPRLILFKAMIKGRFVMRKKYFSPMIGDRIIYLKSVASTNSYAWQLLNAEHPAEGTVVNCTNQTDGRGMQGNNWESEADKNLAFSVILYPEFLDIDYFFALNQVAALSVCEFLRETTGEDFKVKWPNDVMFENKKIAGILIENNLRGNIVTASVAGIGININQTNFMSYMPDAVSLKMITGKIYALDKMLNEVCVKMNDYYDILKQGDYNFLHREYHRFLYRYNEQHQFQKNGIYFNGIIKGVRADGKLLLADEYGINQVIDVKEVRFVY